MSDQLGNIKSDFFVYDIGTGKWTQITDDTAAMGGHSLIFDHQMCLDADKRNIYVFGGQSLPMIGGGGGAEEQRYRITLYHFLLPLLFAFPLAFSLAFPFAFSFSISFAFPFRLSL